VEAIPADGAAAATSVKSCPAINNAITIEIDIFFIFPTQASPKEIKRI
jgi:hypothetical protein